MNLVLIYPYLILYIEESVFCFSANIKQELIYFLKLLYEEAMLKNSTDTLAYCFYFAIKYQIKIELPKKWYVKIIKLNDCISILLGWKYAENYDKRPECIKKFKQFQDGKSKEELIEQDKFWLLLYEMATTESEIPTQQQFLKKLKKQGISFLKF